MKEHIYDKEFVFKYNNVLSMSSDNYLCTRLLNTFHFHYANIRLKEDVPYSYVV